MSSSGDDSDVPEQVSLSISKLQVIGRKNDVAKELAQAKSKRKDRNREKDRQLKQRSSKQETELILDDEDGELKDPRLLPDHLFAVAFNQPPSASGPSAPRDAPPRARQRERKRSDLTPKDRIIGQVPPSLSKGIQLTLANSSRAIRTLSKMSGRAATKHTLPSTSVAKFSSRALNTKGIVSLSQTRGWRREAGKCVPHLYRRQHGDENVPTANTGVMKTTNGPAAHFVRT